MISTSKMEVNSHRNQDQFFIYFLCPMWEKERGENGFSHQNPLGTENSRSSVLLYEPLSAMAEKEHEDSVFIMRDNYAIPNLKEGKKVPCNHVSR